jgi:hypothetical protein
MPLRMSRWSAANALTIALLSLTLLVSFTARPAHAQELSGCWDGVWDNWHDLFKGRMKARIWKCDETHYQGEFWGIALVVIPYRYTSTLTVTHVEDGKTHFCGGDKLPLWGGYTICGYVCGDKLFARYTKCKGDGGGCLEMCRTCCPDCGCR